MGYKFKYYAQPVTTNVHSLWEVVIIEFAVGLICAGMAYWARDIVIQLFVGCAVVAGICLLLTLHNLVLIVRITRQNKKIKAVKEKQKEA